MTINRINEGGTAVFEIKGRLDTITSADAQAIIMPAFDESSKVILDMQDLVYISSAGLRILLLAQKSAAAKNSSFAIRGVPGEIMGVLAMTGLDKVLTIE